MNVHVFLSVKFRAFGMTFGNITKEWHVPVPAVDALANATNIVDFNERGVRLIVGLL